MHLHNAHPESLWLGERLLLNCGFTKHQVSNCDQPVSHTLRSLFNSLNPSTDHVQDMNLRGLSVLAWRIIISQYPREVIICDAIKQNEPELGKKIEI